MSNKLLTPASINPLDLGIATFLFLCHQRKILLFLLGLRCHEENLLNLEFFRRQEHIIVAVDDENTLVSSFLLFPFTKSTSSSPSMTKTPLYPPSSSFLLPLRSLVSSLDCSPLSNLCRFVLDLGFLIEVEARVLAIFLQGAKKGTGFGEV